jgi:hypothetical protein
MVRRNPELTDWIRLYDSCPACDWLTDIKKKKSQVSPKKTTGNIKRSNKEFVLFLLIWL